MILSGSFRCIVAVVSIVVGAEVAAGTRPAEPAQTPIVIGHRGASGYVPEHSLAAYFIAIQQGADYIEPDLVSTRGRSGRTPRGRDRRNHRCRRASGIRRAAYYKSIDGVNITGWFTEDFTLAELKTLRARERIPQIRPDNARFDGQFEVPTLNEVLALVESINEMRERFAHKHEKRGAAPIGVYPETNIRRIRFHRSIARRAPGALAASLWLRRPARCRVHRVLRGRQSQGSAPHDAIAARATHQCNRQAL